ncbi:hypothetical protein HQ563_18485 [bacterium]|nr:hypothetical protein [bacterium]
MSDGRRRAEIPGVVGLIEWLKELMLTGTSREVLWTWGYELAWRRKCRLEADDGECSLDGEEEDGVWSFLQGDCGDGHSCLRRSECVEAFVWMSEKRAD